MLAQFRYNYVSLAQSTTEKGRFRLTFRPYIMLCFLLFSLHYLIIRSFSLKADLGGGKDVVFARSVYSAMRWLADQRTKSEG